MPPAGQVAFTAVTVLGIPELDDADGLAARCREEIAPWFPGKDLTQAAPHIATYRIPFAQFRQAPGIFASLPSHASPIAGAFLAGRVSASSSIQGAMESGKSAAQAVIKALADAE